MFTLIKTVFIPLSFLCFLSFPSFSPLLSLVSSFFFPFFFFPSFPSLFPSLSFLSFPLFPPFPSLCLVPPGYPYHLTNRFSYIIPICIFPYECIEPTTYFINTWRIINERSLKYNEIILKITWHKLEIEIDFCSRTFFGTKLNCSLNENEWKWFEKPWENLYMIHYS